MGLAKFLEARIAEDKLAALTACTGSGDRDWKAEPPGMAEGRIYDSAGEVVVYDEGSPTFAQAQHIARHDPGRVLREVDAKRKILADLDLSYPDQFRIGSNNWFTDRWYAYGTYCDQ